MVTVLLRRRSSQFTQHRSSVIIIVASESIPVVLCAAPKVDVPKMGVPFVTWDDARRQWVVAPAAAEYLGKIDRKIAVVIVAGRYRSGKSFLMNQLAGESGGFSVGHTVESHTKGIWLASRTVRGHTDEGEEVDILFMDSEGLGATDKVRSP